MINFNLEVLGSDRKVISSEKKHIIHSGDLITVYDIKEKTKDLNVKVWAQWEDEEEEYNVNIASDFVPLVVLRDKIYGNPPRKGTMFLYEDEDGNKVKLELDTRTAAALESSLVKDETIRSFYQVYLYSPQITVDFGAGKGANPGETLRAQRARERQVREAKEQERQRKAAEEKLQELEKEKKRLEEEERRRDEERKRLEEEQRRRDEERRQQEEDELKRIEDEKRRLQEEEERRIEDEKLRKDLEELARKYEEERKKAEKEERRRQREQEAFENAPKLPNFMACFFPIKDDEGHYVKVVMRTLFLKGTVE